MTLAILFGGRSVEHEISIRSAANVLEHIDRSRFDVLLVGIDKAGRWYVCDRVEQDIERGDPVSVSIRNGKAAIEHRGSVIGLDVVFPVLHGTDGEDGSVQGFFKALDVPVVGSGVLGSAVCMDKIVTKILLKDAGIPVADFRAFERVEATQIDYRALTRQLGLPFVVKSASLGSSVGVSLVRGQSDFRPAVDEALRYDHRVLVEAFVEGREMECGVIGNGDPQASDPGEIIMKKDYDFYTYKAKYLDADAVGIRIPAEIDMQQADKIRRLSVAAFKALRCEDYARVDLFLTGTGEIMINEINTIPGFTDVSMFPMLWQHMGISYDRLVNQLIDFALERWNGYRALQTDYVNKE